MFRWDLTLIKHHKSEEQENVSAKSEADEIENNFPSVDVLIGFEEFLGTRKFRPHRNFLRREDKQRK